MGAWDDNEGVLLEASIRSFEGDEITFPVAQRTVSGGRAGAARKYPYRNGQDYEDTGQEPRAYSYTVPLFQGLFENGEELYPATYFRLIELMDSDEALGQGELVDPEHGPLTVRFMPWTWTTDPEQRDGGILQLQFETIGDEIVLTRDDSLFTPTAQADVAADALDQQIADSGITSTEIDDSFDEFNVALNAAEIRAGFNTASRYKSLLKSFKSTVIEAPTESTSALTSIDVMRRRTEALIAIGAELPPDESWPIMFNGNILMSAITDLGQEAFRDSPRVIDYEVKRGSSIYEIAIEQFGDVTFADLLIEYNPSVSPNFIPKGTSLIIPILT